MSESERTLRRLALNEEGALAALLGTQFDRDASAGLDAKTRALLHLAAIIVVGASPVTYQWATQAALAAGATDEQIVGTLITVMPVSGLTSAVSAAPELAIALGYEVDEALEPAARHERDG